MNELALFAGVGCGQLATQHLLKWRTIGYVENYPYNQQVLKQRIADGLLDAAPIYGDVRNFIADGHHVEYANSGLVDIITAGWPCQDICSGSTTGTGLSGERSGLWACVAEIIDQIRPRFCLLENSPNLIASGQIRDILRDLAKMGYDADWGCFFASSAAAGSAPHHRERMFLLGKRRTSFFNKCECCEERGCDIHGGHWSDGNCACITEEQWEDLLSDTARFGHKESWQDASLYLVQNQEGQTNKHWDAISVPGTTGKQISWWRGEPGVPRMADRITNRMDRLAAAGEAWVPSVAALAWETLTQL